MRIVTASALKGIREGALREGLTGPDETGEILTEVEAIRDTRLHVQTMAGVSSMEMKAGTRGTFCKFFFIQEGK